MDNDEGHLAAAKAEEKEEEEEKRERGSIKSISGRQYCIMDPNESYTICGLFIATRSAIATSGNDMREET